MFLIFKHFIKTSRNRYGTNQNYDTLSVPLDEIITKENIFGSESSRYINCMICKYAIFNSAVQCKCNPVNVACLRHAKEVLIILYNNKIIIQFLIFNFNFNFNF